MCVYIEQMRCLYHVQSDPQKCWHPVFTALKNIKRENFGEIGKVYLKCWARCLFYVLFFGALLNLASKYLRPKAKRAEPKPAAYAMQSGWGMVDGRI